MADILPLGTFLPSDFRRIERESRRAGARRASDSDEDDEDDEDDEEEEDEEEDSEEEEEPYVSPKRSRVSQVARSSTGGGGGGGGGSSRSGSTRSPAASLRAASTRTSAVGSLVQEKKIESKEKRAVGTAESVIGAVMDAKDRRIERLLRTNKTLKRNQELHKKDTQKMRQQRDEKDTVITNLRTKLRLDAAEAATRQRAITREQVALQEDIVATERLLGAAQAEILLQRARMGGVQEELNRLGARYVEEVRDVRVDVQTTLLQLAADKDTIAKLRAELAARPPDQSAYIKTLVARNLELRKEIDRVTSDIAIAQAALRDARA